MLKRSEKAEVIKELHTKMAKAKASILAEFKAIDVETVTALRKKFRGQNIEYKVVKNTLAKLAAKGTSLESVSELFNGPTAIIMGYADPVTPAKVLQEFLKEKADKLVVKAGVVEGQKIDAKGVEALSKLPGLNELRGKIAGLLSAPATKLVRVLSAPGGQLARVINAHSEKQGKQS